MTSRRTTVSCLDQNGCWGHFLMKIWHFDRKLIWLLLRPTISWSASVGPYIFLDIKSPVRPHLEYAAPIRNPRLKRYITELKRVQRRVTKQVPALNNMGYPDRLRELSLATLRFRRLRGDMIENTSRSMTDMRAHSRLCSLLWRKEVQPADTTSSYRMKESRP